MVIKSKIKEEKIKVKIMEIFLVVYETKRKYSEEIAITTGCALSNPESHIINNSEIEILCVFR